MKREFWKQGALSRRVLLCGGAVALGLPFLESLLPKSARAQASKAKRLLYYWIPNGVVMDTFRPATSGAGYAMPEALASLETLRSDFSIVSGLENVPAKPDMIGDHASGTASFITCIHAFKSESTVSLGISADQIAAKGLGKVTRIPSLQLGTEGGSSAGGCDSGYSCAYTRNISWADATTPLPKMVSPKQVFDAIFMGYDASASQAQIAERIAAQKSVIDAVYDDAKSLNTKLGSSDRVKMDQYLSAVRELEIQTATATMGGSAASCSAGTPPPAMIADYPARLAAMHDLIVLAMQCDATRVFSMMLNNAGTNQTYPALGITRGHHDISHHGGKKENIDLLIKINKWTFEQFAALLTKMKSVTDGADGSNLLTNSTIFLSSDISDGDRHNHDDMPILLAGHGGGALKPGRHVVYAPDKHVPVANLLATTLETVGVKGVVGDSTGTLTEV